MREAFEIALFNLGYVKEDKLSKTKFRCTESFCRNTNFAENKWRPGLRNPSRC